MGRFELRIGGFGGQGVITAGYIVANAASIYNGIYSLMSQSYGPEARGGACRADVIISDKPIDYPKISEPDCLVALSLDAYKQFNGEVKDGGAIIYENSLVSIPKEHGDRDVSYYGVPAMKIAQELGSPLSANMVILGSFMKVTDVVSSDAVRKAIRKRFPRHSSVNLKAFERGREIVKEYSF